MKTTTINLIQKVKDITTYLALCPLMKALSMQSSIISKQKSISAKQQSRINFLEQDLSDQKLYNSYQLKDKEKEIISLKQEIQFLKTIEQKQEKKQEKFHQKFNGLYA